MTEVDIINAHLKNLRGINDLGGAKYQIVWSDNQTEMRHGLYNDFSDEGLFLRTVDETRLVKKYPYISERWVLEKWISPPASINKELPDSIRGTYEPFYVFEDAKGNYLAPTQKVAEFIVLASEKVVRVTAEQRIRDIIYDLEDKERKEYQYFYDMIDSSEIQNALHLKEGVSMRRGKYE